MRVPATSLAGDAMLVTTIVLAFAVNGWRPARAWWVLAAGEVFLVVNDLRSGSRSHRRVSTLSRPGGRR